jgi:hypothetical protein
VRQQYNWFRLADERIQWIEAGEGVCEAALEAVTQSCTEDAQRGTERQREAGRKGVGAGA